MGTSSAWTPERRAKQAAAIKARQPWKQSTGPKTEAGKAASSRNADKGGHRERHRTQMRLRRTIGQAAREMVVIMRAAHADGNLRGECIDPDYDNSERFLAAQATYTHASKAYWHLVWPPDPDGHVRIPLEEYGYDLRALAGRVLAEADADDMAADVSLTGQPDLDAFVASMEGYGYPLVDVAALVLAALETLHGPDDDRAADTALP